MSLCDGEEGAILGEHSSEILPFVDSLSLETPNSIESPSPLSPSVPPLSVVPFPLLSQPTPLPLSLVPVFMRKEGNFFENSGESIVLSTSCNQPTQASESNSPIEDCANLPDLDNNKSEIFVKNGISLYHVLKNQLHHRIIQSKNIILNYKFTPIAFMTIPLVLYITAQYLGDSVYSDRSVSS